MSAEDDNPPVYAGEYGSSRQRGQTIFVVREMVSSVPIHICVVCVINSFFSVVVNCWKV